MRIPLRFTLGIVLAVLLGPVAFPTLAQQMSGATPLSSGSGSASASRELAFYNDSITSYMAYDAPALLNRQPPVSEQAPLFQVVYPREWAASGVPAPLCNPCNHGHKAQVDYTDYHDHVISAIPGMPSYRPWWHVYFILPAYTADAGRDAEIARTYAAHLPVTSEMSVRRLLDARLPNGLPIAMEQDTQFAFFAPVTWGR